MIAMLIIIGLAFAWLLYETDFMRIRLESTEFQKSKAMTAKSEGIDSCLNSTVPTDTEPYKPSVFTPLDMPETTGNLNILCKRS